MSVYTKAASFSSFVQALNKGEFCEIDEHIYDYFLNVLPPIFMGKSVLLVSGKRVYADFGFVEGADTVSAFWKTGDCYYAQQTKLVSRGA